MTAYYNEIDPYCAAWLRNLITAGLIPAGDVDERDIRTVQPADLAGYRQCHFFAGLGGWAYAARLAGWPDDAPLWTGSPPCQDGSVAIAIWDGRRTGLRGDRSGLALTWLALIKGVRPVAIAFENVPGLSEWLPKVNDGLAEPRYRISKSKRAALGVGAPHRRRREWATAHLDGARLALPRPARPSEAEREPWPAPPGDLWRETEPGAWRLDDGLPGRVAKLRALGNSIVPQVGAEVIRSLMEFLR